MPPPSARFTPAPAWHWVYPHARRHGTTALSLRSIGNAALDYSAATAIAAARTTFPVIRTRFYSVVVLDIALRL